MLDDLLDAGSREPVRRRGLPHLRWAVKALLGSAALGAALVVVLLVLGFRMAYPVAAAGIFAAFTLHRLVVGLRVPRRRRHVDNLERVPGARSGDGLGPAVLRWYARLSRKRTLRRDLAELVDERLRQRHGCTLADDPDRARTLLGERLWSYLTGATDRTPSPHHLAAMLTIVEEL